MNKIILKRIALNLFPVLFMIVLSSWGYNGHYVINLNISKHLPVEMQEFFDWNIFLSEHGADADKRKSNDPSEGPKHYIDIDNYEEFKENRILSQSLEELVQKYGSDFVDNNGYLPWATIDCYDSLVSCLKSRNWEKARILLADLGHYVGDGFMPLHITRNYNGQYSGNDGIHFRFESDMINEFFERIDVNSREVQFVNDVPAFIFNYLYENYPYVDSVMAADDYALQITGNNNSYEYLENMWEYSGKWTESLFSGASVAFANLFYTAWVEAGKPSINSTYITRPKEKKLQIYPNPADKTTYVRVTDPTILFNHISICNTGGKRLIHIPARDTDIPVLLETGNLNPGIYFVFLHTAETILTQKLIINH